MSDNISEKISEEIELRMLRSKKPIPLGISNRHLHLSEADCVTIFGKNALTIKSDLKQTGQYASEELVTLTGPKGSIDKVRVLGPFRKQTQIEVSYGDAVKLGVTPPVRDSGKLDATPGVVVKGPAGEVTLNSGVILAKRHIHMSEADAAELKIKDGDEVRVRAGINGPRTVVFEQVLCRVHPTFVLEMHLDREEANACMAQNNDECFIV